MKRLRRGAGAERNGTKMLRLIGSFHGAMRRVPFGRSVVNHLKEAPPMSNVNELVVGYLAAWNERDSARRRTLIGKVWTEEATYVDAHRRGVGHDGIDAMIATAQAQFPGYRLHLV